MKSADNFDALSKEKETARNNIEDIIDVRQKEREAQKFASDFTTGHWSWFRCEAILLNHRVFGWRVWCNPRKVGSTTPQGSVLFCNLRWGNLSKAFIMSKRIIITDIPVFRALVIRLKQSALQVAQFLEKKPRCSKLMSSCFGKHERTFPTSANYGRWLTGRQMVGSQGVLLWVRIITDSSYC